MTRNPPRRRQVLKRIGAGTATVTAAGTAGCLGRLSLEDDGGGGDNGGDEGDDPKLDYGKWVMETETGQPGYLYYEPKAISEYESELGAGWEDSKRFLGGRFRESLDLDFDELRAGLEFAGVSVGATTLEDDELMETLEGKDFERDGEESGYAVYVRDETGETATGRDDTGETVTASEATTTVIPPQKRAFAVKNGTVVTATVGVDDPRSLIERAIATRTGDGSRALEENDDLAALDDALGAGHVTFTDLRAEPVSEERADPETGRFEGQVGGGRRFDFGSDRIDLTWVFLFEEADQIDVDRIEDYFEKSMDRYDDADVTRDGRAATIAASIPTGDLFTTREPTGTRRGTTVGGRTTGGEEPPTSDPDRTTTT